MKHILVTGGAGFIGSNFIRAVLRERDPSKSSGHPWRVTNLDALTYAANLRNLDDVADDPRYRFVHGDIADPEMVRPLVAEADAIVNFAAESHVDRSITGDPAFIRTNVLGVHVLLEAVRALDDRERRFLQVSTDEVYGSVPEGASRETDALAPRNPYSAAKAGGELLARSYWTTYGIPVLVTRGANTVGPYQHVEKVIPLFTTNAMDDIPLPIYGPGTAVRDYLHVDDHCEGLLAVLEKGAPGEVYNLGTDHHANTVELAGAILELLDKPPDLIDHVRDRPGHDQRYCLDSTKAGALGWRPRHDFRSALEKTVRWYVANEAWWRPLKSGEFAAFYEKHYGRPLA